MIVYKIENKVNGKIYIGATKHSLSERIDGHLRDKTKVGQAMHVYGVQSFNISVIDNAESRNILHEKEKYWIRHYDCKYPNGYNRTDGGIGLVNLTQDVRDQISQTNTGHPATEGFTGHKHKEESRKQIGESLKKIYEEHPELREEASKRNSGRIAWNKDLSKETDERVAKIGRPGKPAWNDGLRMKDYDPNYVNSMQGKERPDLSERNRQGIGRVDSEETRLKKSLASQGKPKTKEHVQKIQESKKRNRELKKQPQLYLIASNE
jgi:group I intron endonuclease